MSKSNYNYFEVLGLEVDYWCDDRVVEKQFQKMQKMRHPDETGDSDMSASILINEAYENLMDPMLRAKHVMEINGVDTDFVPTDVKLFTMLNNPEESLRSSSYRMHQYMEEADFESAHKEWYQCKVFKRLLEIRSQKNQG